MTTNHAHHNNWINNSTIQICQLLCQYNLKKAKISAGHIRLRVLRSLNCKSSATKMASVTVMTFVLVSGNQSSESESIRILVSQKQNRSKLEVKKSRTVILKRLANTKQDGKKFVDLWMSLFRVK